MLKKSAMAAGVALVLAVPAHAEFRWEASADYMSGDIDDIDGTGIDADIDVLSVDGSWFYSPVDTSKGPLAEADYLDRASRVDVNFQNGELDFDIDDADISGYGIGTRWVFDKEAGWFVDAAYRQDELENEEFDSFGIGGGKYIFENTAVNIFYIYTDSDCCDDADTYGIELQHLQALPLGSVKLEGSYAYVDPGDDGDVDNYVGRVTYYPIDSLGIGGEWDRSVSGSSSDNWSVFAEWFINDMIAVSASYQDFEQVSVIDGVDGDAFMVGARVRF